MSAGDLVNNLGKLELKLKQVNFRNFRRSELLSGTLDIYVSIYGYVFSDFNRELSKLIASRELELYGKTSKRFVDNLYLIVRDVLHYKPPINKDMFLTNCGFVEMKMIMCTQILELALLKCKQLPSSEKNKKTYRKLAFFPSSIPLKPPVSTNDDKDNTINDVRVHRPQNYVDSKSTIGNMTTSTTKSKRENADHRRVILRSPPSSIKRKISTTEGKNVTVVTKTNDRFSYPLSCHQHQPSNYSGSPDDRISSQIQPHSTSCVISKNPVSKCNIASSSYSKGKPVVLEKQEPPQQKVEVKVVKGPSRSNDGFSAMQRIVTPQELIRLRDISFCRNSFIQNPEISVASHIKSQNQTDQNSCRTKYVAVSEPNSSSNTTSTTSTTTTPIHIESILSLLPSRTSTITKPQNVSPATSTTVIPTSTHSVKLKCLPKKAVPTESKRCKNITTQKVSDEYSRPEEISLTSVSSQAVGPTKPENPQRLSDLHDERSQAIQVLTQFKNLSQNLTACTETLRKMHGRSHEWEVHSDLLNYSGQNKENTPIVKNNSISGNENGIKLLDKTEQNKDESHQLDHWIAKMNLMECSVKSLESKFQSL